MSASPPTRRLLAPDLLRGLLAVFMSLDHIAQFLHAWMHGSGRVNENDGAVVTEWNFDLAWSIRMASHLCPAGFAFLLGMGLVQRFSRRRWPARQMLQHLLVRSVGLTAGSIAFGLLYSWGEIWLLNVVMVALAVDYFLAGVVCLILQETEEAMIKWLRWAMFHFVGDDAETAILASSMSWHIHNATLACFTAIAASWNIWLSPSGGHCLGEVHDGYEHHPLRHWGLLEYMPVRFLFHGVITKRVHSIYPPLAWLSFVIAGLLAGRILVGRPPSPQAQSRGFLAAGLIFGGTFVLTRIHHIGNLSEECLRTPDQLVDSTRNPFLVSFKSFFYVVKYPPDLAYFYYGMAGNMLLLSLFSAIHVDTISSFFPLRVLLSFGQSAMFFYYSHLLLVMGICGVTVKLFGHTTTYVDAHSLQPEPGVDSLWGFWVLWITVMCIMVNLCSWHHP